jgi:hypothetical protein
MQPKRNFAGGLLIGLAISPLLGVLVLFPGLWVHHMFILGVQSWPVFLVTAGVPLALILIGAYLARTGTRLRP